VSVCTCFAGVGDGDAFAVADGIGVGVVTTTRGLGGVGVAAGRKALSAFTMRLSAERAESPNKSERAAIRIVRWFIVENCSLYAAH